MDRQSKIAWAKKHSEPMVEQVLYEIGERLDEDGLGFEVTNDDISDIFDLFCSLWVSGTIKEENE